MVNKFINLIITRTDYNTKTTAIPCEKSTVSAHTLVRSAYIRMCTALLSTGATAASVAGSPRLLELIFTHSISF